MNKLQLQEKNLKKKASLEYLIESDIDARELSPSNSCKDGDAR
ncbi:hypothetical protein QUA43_08305 [Microcoleus sp. N9_B4]